MTGAVNCFVRVAMQTQRVPDEQSKSSVACCTRADQCRSPCTRSYPVSVPQWPLTLHDRPRPRPRGGEKNNVSASGSLSVPSLAASRIVARLERAFEEHKVSGTLNDSAAHALTHLHRMPRGTRDRASELAVHILLYKSVRVHGARGRTP
ncbi:hypothetical protein OH76DRAFT_261805 [Lentinus brumalis]|uniref:Uncharacterized protein n=1 Tax=Lentinus brumalis TaxID=2498619 RepID=A0A371DGL3_9APHY|nr:hypothetical protein OH76DRAFT_261805 [Polyporus brumalis]